MHGLALAWHGKVWPRPCPSRAKSIIIRCIECIPPHLTLTAFSSPESVSGLVLSQNQQHALQHNVGEHGLAAP